MNTHFHGARSFTLQSCHPLRLRSSLLAACLMFAVSCGTPPAPEAEISALPEVAVLPAFALHDENSEAFSLDSLTGKVWVADFIFTRCPTTCPIQTAQMKRLQEILKTKPYWDDIRLVSFSVDPEHDVPDVLREYARATEAESGRWYFITGSRGAIWELSTDGFKLAAGESAEGDGPLFHSSKFVLVDGAGRIRGYYDGLTDEGIDALVHDLDTHAAALSGNGAQRETAV